jgi:hypothetical protein
MPNPHRGEIEACLDGQSFNLCLTLGALAELEHTFGHEDMLSLAERFQSGRLSARDAQRIIGAGLRGAGNEIRDDAVARLLGATFGGPIVGPIDGAVAGKLATSAIESVIASPRVHSRKPRPSPQGEGEAIRDLSPEEERTSPGPFRGAR